MSIGGSIALIAIGAILRFAVKRDVEGINLDLIGMILMIAGPVALVIALLMTGTVRRQTLRRVDAKPIGQTRRDVAIPGVTRSSPGSSASRSGRRAMG